MVQYGLPPLHGPELTSACINFAKAVEHFDPTLSVIFNGASSAAFLWYRACEIAAGGNHEKLRQLEEEKKHVWFKRQQTTEPVISVTIVKVGLNGKFTTITSSEYSKLAQAILHKPREQRAEEVSYFGTRNQPGTHPPVEFEVFFNVNEHDLPLLTRLNLFPPRQRLSNILVSEPAALWRRSLDHVDDETGVPEEFSALLHVFDIVLDSWEVKTVQALPGFPFSDDRLKLAWYLWQPRHHIVETKNKILAWTNHVNVKLEQLSRDPDADLEESFDLQSKQAVLIDFWHRLDKVKDLTKEEAESLLADRPSTVSGLIIDLLTSHRSEVRQAGSTLSMIALDKLALPDESQKRLGERAQEASGTNSLGHPLVHSHLLSKSEGNVSASSERNLDKWKEENDEEDDFGISGGESARVGSAGEGTKSEGKLNKERAKRAVTSESWDDDFLFQHEPAPPKFPNRSHSRSPSRDSRPTTPLSSRTSPTTVTDGSTRTTSTARPTSSSSQKTVTSSLEIHLPRRPPARPISYSSSSRVPSNATTNRSDTPSLTADSLRSFASTFTTGDELKTETEDDETEDERQTIATSPRSGLFNLKRYSRELLPSPPTSPSLKPSQSKRWKFGRSKKEAQDTEAKEVGQRPSGIFGRRTGPRELEEVVTVDSHDPNLRRSGLPLPARDGQFVVLGRRSRTSTETATSSNQSPTQIASTPRSTPLSSNSKPTNDNANSQTHRHRTSLQFLPSSQARSPPSSHLPLSPGLVPTPNNWSEYDATTTMARDEETNDDVSEFSGDERFHLPTRLSNIRRRSIAATTPSTSCSPQSPTFPFDFARPSSPVESILGDRIGKWNTSQVSFASSISPSGLHQTQVSTTESLSTGYDTTRPEDHIKNRKRKLVKRRPGSESIETGTQPSLGIEEGSSRRPLLSAVSSRSSSSSNPLANSSILQLPSPSQHARSPSLPFAQDSDRESPQRPPNCRRRSSTTPSKATPPERGQVVEIDREWLGIVPFPPSPPRPSHNSHPVAFSLSTSLRRPAPSRSVSGKSHPPITMKTQAETKAKRNSGGIGQSISNILSRSTSALPLGASTSGGGKRAPSPAPSAKSGRSNKSLLTRGTSRKGKKRESQDVVAGPSLPKSPSISFLKKQPSTVISPTATQPPRLPLSSPSTPTSTVRLTESTRTSTDASCVKSPPISSPSFFNRARKLSRSTTSNANPPPSPTMTRSSSARQMPPPAIPSRSPPNSPNSTTKGQLNTSFKMPRKQTALPSQDPGPSLKPLPNGVSANPSKSIKKESSPQTRSAQAGHRPSLSLSSIMRSSAPSIKVGNTPPLPSSVIPSSPARPSEPFERPRTALGTDYPPILTKHGGEDDDFDFILPRRNSLSDLRIPARITNAQKKIEEDLERVKQFAQGVEDLKALRRQYEQLLHILAGSSTLDPATPRHSLDISVTLSNKRTAQGIRKLELDYSQWWEQAGTLIDLGDGKPQQPQRTSLAILASRRDRCVSMAADSSASNSTSNLVVSGSETETEESQLASRSTSTSRPSSVLFSLSTTSNSSRRRSLARMPSASSIETEASVGARQREMLRGVLAPVNKGASLPSRGPPSPRPSLAVLSSSGPIIEQPHSSPVPSSSPTKRPPFSLQLPSSSTPSSNNSRRVSRVGVSGIREFLLRLRHQLANSVGSLPPPAPPPATSTSQLLSSTSGAPRRSVSDPTSRPVTPSHSRRSTPSSLLQHVAASSTSESTSRRRSLSSSSEEDWDAELASSRSGDSPVERSDSPASLRRSRTVSTGNPSSTISSLAKGGGKDMMILTTENMPQLLNKVKEVQEKCETCIDLLKGLTV
ncbi:hypothetical protein JCM3765_006438 [Sporobolomyces pararoseus]